MNIVTPVNTDLLEKLLIQSKYDREETKYLVDGFRNGFDIKYEGPQDRRDYSENIPFKSVGSSQELWEKLMKEVKLKRYAGPFNKVPFSNFIQSPIGLVPKAGNKTRLIFHLSYDFPKSGNSSINSHTRREYCTVKYNDLDEAVKLAVKLLGKDKEIIYCSKTDLSSAFRMVGLNKKCWNWLVMKATNLESGETKFFFDKCLPFGHSISCAIFQQFSNALKHILEYRMGKKGQIMNYLDDFLFLATSAEECDFGWRKNLPNYATNWEFLLRMRKWNGAQPESYFWGSSLTEKYTCFQCLTRNI